MMAGGHATELETWDQDELIRLMDVQPAGDGRYVAPAHGRSVRNVVEAGQLLADAVVATSKELPDQRVTSASMIFSKAAAHDVAVDLEVDVLRGGRTMSTVQVRASQDGSLRAAALLLLQAGADELIRSSMPMPDVPGPERLRPLDRAGMLVDGREFRVVDDAYDDNPDHVGPAELFVWARFQDAPRSALLHTALMTHSTTHWTIAAALRPHPGVSEAMAHTTISTGISMATVAYHEQVDVSRWLLYANSIVATGQGTTQGEGRVYAEDGRLVASYAVHGMIRPMTTRSARADMAL